MTGLLYAIALALVALYAHLVQHAQTTAGDLGPLYALLVLALWAGIRNREDVR